MVETNQHCDLLIVGAGPAGLAAAYRATNAGLSVTVVDDNPDAGGQIWRGEKRKTTSPEAAVWFERIRSAPINFVNGARVFAQPAPDRLVAEVPGGVTEFSYSNLILATGARERFIPFPGWTLPNVMGAGGLQAIVKTGLPIEGQRVVVAGTGPLLLAVASYLKQKGAEVLLVAEQASAASLARFGLALVGQSGKIAQAFQLKKALAGIDYLNGCWPVAATGNRKLEKVVLRRGSKTWKVECDYLACGFHLVPNLELGALLNCRIESGAIAVDDFQQTSVERVYAVGEATGIGGLELSLVEGEIAGLAAAGQQAEARKLFRVRSKQRRFANVLNKTFALRDELRDLAVSDTIVCRCEDVTLARLREHSSWRSAKLHTRCGMGPCQGRICGSAVEFVLGWTPESVRPPVFPVRVDSLISK
jgi:NADPH-dependent 2,4-dienoyl-CoA reductase/sulfur reductase-like enzyme